MKKWVLALALTASVIGLVACSGNGEEEIVKSKAGNVTKDELYEAMKDRVGPFILEQIIVDKVLADKYGEVSDEELDERLNKIKDQLGPMFAIQLQQIGFTSEDEFKERLRFSILQEKAAMSDVNVTEDEVKEYYDAYEPEIGVRHIIVGKEDEELIKEIKTKLDNGEDFAELAKEYSIDGTKDTGGDLGKLSKDDPSLDADFKEVAFELPQDEISEPFETQFGWHIVQVTDKPEKGAFDEVKEDFEYELKLTKIDQNMVEAAIKRELQEADIDIQDKELESALDYYLATPDQENEDNEQDDNE